MSLVSFSSIETRYKFIFRLYDFDEDSKVTREDVRTVLSYVPINPIVDGNSVEAEGSFT